MLFSRKNIRLAALIAVLILALASSPAWAAKNVIIMVADGAGYNSWLAASMYQGKVGKQVYDRPGWVKIMGTTYPLNLANRPTGNLEQDRTVIYDSDKAWDAAKRSEKTGDFAGYAYLKTTATDSAASATAMATGRKTYDNAINWTSDDRPMAGGSIAEIAKAKGKAAGVVTTVAWSHATPASFGGAHNVYRNNYVEIANEMLDAPWLDVIMGAGHPEFDNNSQPKKPKKADYEYVGGKETWEQLINGKHPGGWKLIQSKEEFEKLASGAESAPPKLLGTVRAATTLQEQRKAPLKLDGQKAQSGVPFAIPFNKDVPTLAVMSQAAIHVLEKNPRGFYLMIEGGAVDFANHANDKARLIEEQVDFVQAVEAVVDWIERNGNWDDTLLILTADHDCGLLWGPESDTIAFQPLEDRGQGKLPGMKYNVSGHANSLVPIYARGKDAERFRTLIKGKDAQAAAAWNVSGEYVDDADIFAVMKAAMERTEGMGVSQGGTGVSPVRE